MNNLDLFYFTARCLMLDDHPELGEEIKATMKEEKIDWNRFVSLCSNNLILPVIYLKFKRNNIIELLPSGLSDFLKEIYDLNVIRNTLILKQINEVTETLNKNHITPIFLKGAAHLIDEVYSDIGERIMTDIDFLVSEEDYLKSANILMDNGYSIPTDIPAFVIPEYQKHYPRLSKKGYVADLEVHRTLTEQTLNWFNSRIVTAEMRPSKKLNKCYVLSDKHKIIHNFVHSQMNSDGHSESIISLKDIYDLYLLSKNTSLLPVLQAIECKQKAIGYFAFADKTFGLNKTLFPETNIYSKILIFRHNLNQRSFIFYHINRTIRFFKHRIFEVYLAYLIKSVYSREMRRSVIKKFRDPEWYRLFFRHYTNFFSRK